MKIARYLPLALWLMLAACNGRINENPSVFFAEPQPAKGRNFDALPREFQGEYVSEKGDTLVAGPSYLAFVQRGETFHVGKRQLDSFGLKAEDGLIFGNDRGKGGIPYRLERDTYFFQISMADTLLRLEGDNILRKHKGAYFWSTRLDHGWTVHHLGFDKNGSLRIEQMDDSVDLALLKEFDAVSAFDLNQTQAWMAQPSLRQFNKYLRHRNWESGEAYRKVR